MSTNSASSKKPRIKYCVFRKEWRSQSKYESWVLPVDDNPTTARCTTCASTFTVKFDGINAVKNHASSQKHKQNIPSPKQSAVLTKFFTPKSSSAEDEVTAAELGAIFHGLKHNHSYLSMDCGSKLMSTVLPDSGIALRCRIRKTKMEHIVQDALVPYVAECVVGKLQTGCNLPLSVSTDASNKGNRKFFPIVDAILQHEWRWHYRRSHRLL